MKITKFSWLNHRGLARVHSILGLLLKSNANKGLVHRFIYECEEMKRARDKPSCPILKAVRQLVPQYERLPHSLHACNVQIGSCILVRRASRRPSRCLPRAQRRIS